MGKDRETANQRRGAARAAGAAVALLALLVVATAAPAALAAPPGPLSTATGHWSWQNPLPQGDDLTGVDFVDAQNGWATGTYRDESANGDVGFVLRTTDGGASWTMSLPHVDGGLYDVDFVDALRGWAVGGFGTIARTTDGGATWTAQRCGSRPLFAVSFPNATHGWAAGSLGAMVRTTDGGATWTTRHSGTVFRLNDIFFVDASHGWATGNEGLIMRTVNGGATWGRKVIDGNPWLREVGFATTQRGWAVGDRGLIMRSTNGGQSWFRQDSGTTWGGFRCLAVVDTQHAFAAGDQLLRATTNGGATWVKQDGALQDQFVSAIAAADAQHACLVGNGGYLRATTDGGDDWSPTGGVGHGDSLSSVAFADPTVGWAASLYPGRILGTTDGGATWAPQTQTGTRNLTALAAADATHAWATTDEGRVLRTTDGSSWDQVTAASGVPLYGIDFVDTQQGWLVGADGLSAVSSDGGLTWRRHDTGVNVNLRAVRFVDLLRGWACGDHGRIVATVDGGLNWTSQDSGADAQTTLRDLAFAADGLNGWAVGDTSTWEGVLLHTSDGGASWQRQRFETSAVDRLRGVDAVDAAQAWIVALDGSILRTTDGGATWGPQQSGADRLSDVAAVDAQHVWAVGDGGAILATADGGGEPPPLTSSSPDAMTWSKSPVVVALTAQARSAAGVALTQFKLDSGPWHPGTTATVPAPSNHSGDGVRVLSFRSWDGALPPALEPAKTLLVGIDTTRPQTVARAAVTVQQGATTWLPYAVSDPALRGAGTVDVTIAIWRSGTKVRTLHVGNVVANAFKTYRWVCTLSPGSYRYTIAAVDPVGLTQSVTGSNTLTVK